MKRAKTKITVEQKLRFLYDLQLIHSRINTIRSIRGELPLEIRDLEDSIKGLETRIETNQAELEEINKNIKNKEIAIQNSKQATERYTKQLDNVSNNKEYEALSKEIEYQELEIQLNEKKISKETPLIEEKNNIIENTKEEIKEKQEHLESKKKRLDEIVQDTKKEEEFLNEKSLTFSKKIEDRLLAVYEKIRSKVGNGEAVVPIDRGASSGSYFEIPPQLQLEIEERNKIIIDEYSGRILIDSELAKEESKKMKKYFSDL